MIASCGSFIRCFNGIRLNEPVRLNCLVVSVSVELSDELFTELPAEFKLELLIAAVQLAGFDFKSASFASRFCLRSKQTANEQPTA